MPTLLRRVDIYIVTSRTVGSADYGFYLARTASAQLVEARCRLMGTNSSQPLPSQQSETGAVQAAMAQSQDPAKAAGASHGALPVANNRKRKDSDAPHEKDGARTRKRSRKHDGESDLHARGLAVEVSNGTINETDTPQDGSGVNNGLKKKKERKHRKEKGHGDDFPEMTIDEKQKRREKRKKKHMAVGIEIPDSNGFKMTSMNPQLANGSSIPRATTPQNSTIQPTEKKRIKKEQKETSQSQGPIASRTPTNHRNPKHGAIQFTPINGEANGTMITPTRESRSMERTIVGDIIPPRILADGPKGGLWTEEEKAIVNEVFQEVCAVENIDEAQLAENVAAGEKITTLLNCLREALPMRTRDSIRKFCQRQYRRGTRGPWSAEEDATLQDQIAQRGKKWAEIARIVDRTPDDCRDRYQKILQYGSDREQGTWSQQDALRLYRAVEECVAEIVDYTEGDVYDFVNWEVVANKMGHRRSAKRCREKWQSLRDRGFSDQISLEEWTEDSSRIHWRYGASEKQFAHFKNGDKYDALMEIYSSFRDPTEIFTEQTFWTRVCAQVGESRFDKRLRRFVFYHLLEQCDSSSIRQEASKAMQAKMMAERIVQEAHETGEELERGFDEDCFYHPAAKARRVKAEALRRAHAAQKRRQKSHRSEEFVYESDDSGQSPAQADVSRLFASASQAVNKSLADLRPSQDENSRTTDALAMSPHLQSGSSWPSGLQMETATEDQHSTLAEKPSSHTNTDRTARKMARKQKTGLAPADHDLPAFLTPSQLSATQANEGDEVMENHVDDKEARRMKKLEKKRRKEERRRQRLNE